jgi:hypothetical protein
VSRGVGNGPSDRIVGGPNVDPYEWTENTNNKKKRKIPTHTNPGGSTGASGTGVSCSGTHSSPGFSPTPTPRSRWKSNGSSQRSPLSSVSSVNHISLRRTSRRYPSSPSVDSYSRLVSGQPRDERTTPLKGKGRNSTGDSGLPKQTRFTFECHSPVSATLAYTSSAPISSSNTGGNGFSYTKSMQTVGTQTSPGISNSNTYHPPSQSIKKKSLKPSRREILQQQQRRRREVAAHGNNNGEIWICEFCEYESIFGHPPEALMRQYEVKDRKERRRLAEKRRLLEKAKQKGKKPPRKNIGKRGANHHSNATPPAPPPSATDSQGTQSDDAPFASTEQTPSLKPTRHSQKVQTELFLERSCHVSNGRGAFGIGSGGGGWLDPTGNRSTSPATI